MKSLFSRLFLAFFITPAILSYVCHGQTQTFKEKTLYTFCSVTNDGDGNCADGSSPASLIQGNDGNLYGIATQDGAGGGGNVFKITPSGAFTVLYSFCSEYNENDYCADGEYPAALTLGADGNFYGLTTQGGSMETEGEDGGTFFKVTPSGTMTILANLDFGLFYFPLGLIQATDGNFYGTTYGGGANGDGSIFRITPAGTFTTFYSFCNLADCLDGNDPGGGLTKGADGNLYGTTYSGGATDQGTVFRISLAGVLDTFYYFCTQTDCPDGSGPELTMLQGTDGNFYGSADGGGLYRITPSGALTFLASEIAYPACPTGLLQATDGNIYGITQCLGSEQVGNFFEYTKPETAGGAYTSLYSFGIQASDGWTPTSVIQAKNGNFYGTNSEGPTYYYAGTVFEIGAVKAESASAITASPNPVISGQVVTLTASSSGSYGTPTGSITFSTNGTTIGSATLNSGVAKFSANSSGIAPGIYPVIATYSGSSTYNSSVSAPVDVFLKAATSTTIAAFPNPVTPPAAETLTATVKRSGATGTPTGDVTFYSGSTVLGTANLNSSGVATFSGPTSGIGAGKYAVTAAYNGDNSDGTSTSPAVTVQVE